MHGLAPSSRYIGVGITTAYYTWALDFGFPSFFLDSADAPCYQKGSVFDLAFPYSDALSVDSGVFRRCFPGA